MEDGVRIKAPFVVFDTGLVNTATKLLPKNLIKLNLAKDDKHLRPSITGATLFVGLKGDPRELNLPNCITWVAPSNDLSGDVEKLQEMSLDGALKLEPHDLGLFISIPCTNDSGWMEKYPNKFAIEIITLQPWHWFQKFEHLSDDNLHEYEEAKKEFAEKIWLRVSAGKQFRHIEDEVNVYSNIHLLSFTR